MSAFSNGYGVEETPFSDEQPKLLQYCCIPMEFTLRWEKADGSLYILFQHQDVVADGQRGLKYTSIDMCWNRVGISLGGTTYNMTGAVVMVHYLHTDQSVALCGDLGVMTEKIHYKTLPENQDNVRVLFSFL